MKTKIKRGFILSLLILLLISSSYIFFYYLSIKEIDQLSHLPRLFLIAVSLYIIGQIVKQFIEKTRPWYNYLYYIGLLTIVVPLPLYNVTEDWLFMVPRFGTVFLIIPPVIEIVLMRNEIKKEKETEIEAEDIQKKGTLETDVERTEND